MEEPSLDRKRSSPYPVELRVVHESFYEITVSSKDSPKDIMRTALGEERLSSQQKQVDISYVGKADVEKKKKKGTKCRKMYLAALAALLSSVAMGMTTGYSGPATYDMEKRANSRIKVDDDEVTWIGSIVPVGALTAGIFAGPLADKFGRKEVLIYNCVPFVAGWILIIYAPTVFVLLIGRYVTGFACGLVSVAVPMYAVEISTPGVRGLLGASYQGLLVVGSLLSMCIGAYIPWSWLAVASALMVCAGLICLCPMPESPRWLVAHGRWEEAIESVQFCQGDHLDAKTECTLIMEDLKMQPKGSLALRDFLSPTVYKPTLLSAALMFFQQLSGANVVLYYTPSIFASAGSTLEPETSAIIVLSIQVVATLLSTVLVDKAGRRVMLLLSGFVMALSMTSLATFLFLDEKDPSVHQTMGWLPLASLLVFISAFSFGYGPIPWLMAAEMVPVRARSIVSGIATFFNGLFAFAVTKSFKMMEEKMNAYGVYWTYSGISLLGCICVWFFLPETKGKRLEDIQKVFIGRRKQTGAERAISSITLREEV